MASPFVHWQTLLNVLKQSNDRPLINRLPVVLLIEAKPGGLLRYSAAIRLGGHDPQGLWSRK
jgi:hypothetical protein